MRQQQKTVEKTVKKAGKSERKREKLLENINKQKFIEVLNRPNEKVTTNEIKSEDEVCTLNSRNNGSYERYATVPKTYSQINNNDAHRLFLLFIFSIAGYGEQRR